MLLVSGEEAVPVNISNFVIHDVKNFVLMILIGMQASFLTYP